MGIGFQEIADGAHLTARPVDKRTSAVPPSAHLPVPSAWRQPDNHWMSLHAPPVRSQHPDRNDGQLDLRLLPSAKRKCRIS